MVNEEEDILNPNYSVDISYFWDGGDYVRIIIVLYIILSIFFNLLIVISIFLSKKKLSPAGKITLNIIFVNFAHTFTYLYQWVIKNKGNPYTIIGKENGNSIVGYLLAGNPNNMGICKTQSFFLISSSISQDMLINIFFFLINKSKMPEELYIWIAVLCLGYAFPILFTFLYLFFDLLGINDSFCYVKKYMFNQDEKKYERFDGFQRSVNLVYTIRVLNLIFSFFLFVKIIIYVRSRKYSIKYIFKITIILLVQLVTVSIGVIYRASSIFSPEFSNNFAGEYLILNTMDGVLFPVAYIYSNKIYIILYKAFIAKTNKEDSDKENADGEGEGEEEEEEVEKAREEELDSEDSNKNCELSKNPTYEEKSLSISEIKDPNESNNFDS